MGKYCIDSDTLIHLYQHSPARLTVLGRLCKRQLICIPEGVYREIRRKSDKLKTLLEKWDEDYDVVTRLGTDKRAKDLLPEIERKYGPAILLGGTSRKGFWDSKAGRKSADSQVVTLAKANGMIAVSNDQAIGDASLLEGVPCITWQEFARRMDAGEIGG